MKTESTNEKVPEASERLSGELPFQLPTHKTTSEALGDQIKLRVQDTLDELFSEQLIPFELTAHKVNADGPDEYVVPFYDSRMHSISFTCKKGESFTEKVRAAVLDRVKRLSGPLKNVAFASH